jgi:hypothetical protein
MRVAARSATWLLLFGSPRTRSKSPTSRRPSSSRRARRGSLRPTHLFSPTERGDVHLLQARVGARGDRPTHVAGEPSGLTATVAAWQGACTTPCDRAGRPRQRSSLPLPRHHQETCMPPPGRRSRPGAPLPSRTTARSQGRRAMGSRAARPRPRPAAEGRGPLPRRHRAPAPRRSAPTREASQPPTITTKLGQELVAPAADPARRLAGLPREHERIAAQQPQDRPPCAPERPSSSVTLDMLTSSV